MISEPTLLITTFCAIMLGFAGSGWVVYRALGARVVIDAKPVTLFVLLAALGERVTSIFLTLLAMIGVGFSTGLIIIAISCATLALTLLRLQLKANSDHPATVTKSTRNHNPNHFLFLIYATSFSLFLLLSSRMIFLPLMTWDNHNHWLVLPLDILRWDAWYGSLNWSHSVAPYYHPAQILLGSALLKTGEFFLGTGRAETILQLNNAYASAACAAVVGEAVSKLHANKIRPHTFLAPCIVAIVATSIYYADITYVHGFYADGTIALLTLAAFSVAFTGYERTTALGIILVATNLVTGKLNIYPVAPLIILIWAHSRGNPLPRTIGLAFAALLIVTLEFAFFASISPKMVVLDPTAHISPSIALDPTQIYERLRQIATFAPENKTWLLIAAAIALAHIVLGFLMRTKTNALMLSAALQIVFLAAILTIMTIVPVNLENSLPRYIQTLIPIWALGASIGTSILLQSFPAGICAQFLAPAFVVSLTIVLAADVALKLPEKTPLIFGKLPPPAQPQFTIDPPTISGDLSPKKLYLVDGGTPYAERHWNTAFARRRLELYVPIHQEKFRESEIKDWQSLRLTLALKGYSGVVIPSQSATLKYHHPPGVYIFH